MEGCMTDGTQTDQSLKGFENVQIFLEVNGAQAR